MAKIFIECFPQMSSLLIASDELIDLILTLTLLRWSYYCHHPHFTDEEMRLGRLKS